MPSKHLLMPLSWPRPHAAVAEKRSLMPLSRRSATMPQIVKELGPMPRQISIGL